MDELWLDSLAGMGSLARGSESGAEGAAALATPGTPAHTVLPLCPHPAGGGAPWRASSSWCLMAGSRRVTQKWRSRWQLAGPPETLFPGVRDTLLSAPLGSEGLPVLCQESWGPAGSVSAHWGRHCAPHSAAVSSSRTWIILYMGHPIHGSSCTRIGDSPDPPASGGGMVTGGRGVGLLFLPGIWVCRTRLHAQASASYALIHALGSYVNRVTRRQAGW